MTKYISSVKENQPWCRNIMSKLRVRSPLELINTDFIKLEQNLIEMTEESISEQKFSIPLEISKVTKSPPKKRTSKRLRKKKATAKPRKKTTKKSASKRKLLDSLDVSNISESPTKKMKLQSTSQSTKSQKKSSKIEKKPAEPLLYEILRNGEFRCTVCKQKFSHRYKVNQHIKSKHVEKTPEIFHCAHCDKNYRSKYLLSVHINQHSENSSDYLYACSKCDFKAKFKHYLKAHLIRRHTDDYNFECDHCNKRFKIKADLRLHLSIHDELQHICDICGHLYRNNDALVRHRRVMHINEYKYKCKICNQKLLTEKNLNSHIKKSHENPYKCDDCDVTFKRKCYLKRHKSIVHELEKNHLCPVCGKKFYCSATLRIHQLTHAKAKPYLCNVCGSRFTQRSSMMLHWKKKHPDAERPPPPVKLTEFVNPVQPEAKTR